MQWSDMHLVSNYTNWYYIIYKGSNLIGTTTDITNFRFEYVSLNTMYTSKGKYPGYEYCFGIHFFNGYHLSLTNIRLYITNY